MEALLLLMKEVYIPSLFKNESGLPESSQKDLMGIFAGLQP